MCIIPVSREPCVCPRSGPPCTVVCWFANLCCTHPSYHPAIQRPVGNRSWDENTYTSLHSESGPHIRDMTSSSGTTSRRDPRPGCR